MSAFSGATGLVRSVVLVLATALGSAGNENVVLQWNAATLDAIKATSMAPTIAARALAIVHTAAYDAWAAYHSRAVGTRLGDTLRQPAAMRTNANRQKAISFAAYRASTDLFPSQKTAIFDPLMARLGYDPLDLTMARDTPSGVGNIVARALLDYRHSDGSNQLGDLNPGAYSDYTGYKPVNTATTVTDPSRWQPVPIFNGTTFVVPNFLTAFWGRVLPFTDASLQSRPAAPAQFSDRGYETQVNELLEISARLTDRQKMISEYWSDSPGTVTPPGHWNELAQWVSRRDDHTLSRDVRMFFVLNNALLDVSVAVWECKRHYDSVRPITAIHYLKAGKKVKAWAGPSLGTQEINGENWLPYQPSTFITPPFPEHVSGHSTFSSAAAYILTRFTGDDRFGASVVLSPGSSVIEPGVTPARRIVLRWPRFSDAAEEAGMSRLYGGIHFPNGNLLGQELGRHVARAVWEKAESYLRGSN